MIASVTTAQEFPKKGESRNESPSASSPLCSENSGQKSAQSASSPQEKILSANHAATVSYHLLVHTIPDSTVAIWFESNNVSFLTPTDRNAEKADAQLWDCRGCKVEKPQAMRKISAGLPVMILVDEQSTLTSVDTPLSTIVEMVSVKELSSPMLLTRLKMVLLRARQPLNENIVGKHAEQLLKTVMAQSTDWMVVKDLNNRFLLASQSFCNATNLSEQDIIGKNDIDIGTSEKLVLGDQATGWKGYWELDQEVIRSTQAVASEHLVVAETDNGEVRERTDKIPLKDAMGNVYALLVSVTEVYREINNNNPPQPASSLAKRRNLDRSPILRQLNEERHEAELKKLATEQAFLVKNKFIASASHDLRQPLHALGLFVDSLERRCEGENELFLISKIRECSHALEDLLNGLLDISRLDANVITIEKTEFVIGKLLHTIEDEYKAQAKQKNLILTFNNSDAVAYSDVLLLGRIVRNLVNNAIEHTSRGMINVVTEVTDGNIQINVIDTGPGIPADQHEAIFAEYHQLNNPERDRSKGLGLGLAVVSRLCKLLDIDIKLRSKSGRGASFSISVPLARIRSEEAAAPIPDPPSIADYMIMVVDDNGSVREAMQTMLDSYGSYTLVADSASMAIEQLRNETREVDIMLVDYRLRDSVTGDQAIAEICNALNRKIPSIIITGDTSTDSLKRASASGYPVLNKPVPTQELIASIVSTVG